MLGSGRVFRRFVARCLTGILGASSGWKFSSKISGLGFWYYNTAYATPAKPVLSSSNALSVVMAGLDPATQPGLPVPESFAGSPGPGRGWRLEDQCEKKGGLALSRE